MGNDWSIITSNHAKIKPVASPGERGGADRRGRHPPGVTPERKNVVGKFTKNSGQTGRIGKKVRVTPSRGDTRVKSIKLTVMGKKE